MWAALGQRLRRRGLKRLVVGYVWEPQKRGVGHLHVVVALAGISVVAGMLQDLAPAYGFGFVDDGSRSRRRGGGGNVAGYLVGYLNGGKVAATVEAIERCELPARSWYVASWLTQLSRVTMRALRRGRRLWATEVGLMAPPPDVGCMRIWDLLRTGSDSMRRGPPGRPQVRALLAAVMS
jgi:hypothetical protein